jgi:hypothetical protein
MLLALLAMASIDQGYDTDARMWVAMTGEISARCLIEVASATNEQSLLTQELYRQAAERKAIQLAGATAAMAHATDNLIAAHDRLMARQRDLLDNHLITRAEYDAVAGQGPDLSFISQMLRQYPACDFLRAEFGPTAQRARELWGR